MERPIENVLDDISHYAKLLANEPKAMEKYRSVLVEMHDAIYGIAFSYPLAENQPVVQAIVA